MKALFLISVVLVQPLISKPDITVYPLPIEVNQVETRVASFKPRKELKPPKPLVTEVTSKTYPTANLGGSCDEWIKAAGIKEISAAKELIRRESQCNPYAVNKSSGACNVAQELPCGKSGCKLGDGACSVGWMNQYCLNRYGSWAAALRHHDSHGWY